jgi:hypothetical protein
MANLLDEASILLTPTAYNNGSMLAVKPTNGDGDFTFSRNSAATRVNAQGLVENVQILSSNLVSNGDFSQGGQDWTITSGASIGENKLDIDAGAFDFFAKQTAITSGLNYKITLDAVVTSGNILLYTGTQFATISNSGSYTFITTSDSTQIRFRSSGSALVGSITNISVIEITDDTNLPRIDYTDGCGSLLLEPQSTNLVYNSNDGFASSSMNLVYNSEISPDGTQNAYKSTTTNATAAHVRTLNVAFSNTSVFSMFLKYGNNQWYQIINAAKTGNFVNVDIQNGVFGTNGADTENLSIKDFGNGWYRVSGTFINALSTGTLRVYAGSSSSSNWAATSAPIGSYNYGFGFQVEQNSYATSYIPTQGATSTRLADIATNSGNASLINSEEGTLYFEGSALANDGTNRVITLSKSSDWSNRTFLRYDASANSITYRYLVNGSIKVNLVHTLSNATILNKIACKWELNNFKLYVNGLNVGQDLSGSVISADSLNKLNFNDGLGTNKFYGKNKALAVYKTALTDEQLTLLTTI